MGTDIHGVFQRREGESWVDISSDYAQNRHYQLFAVLAGVRNGSGFAGVLTGEAVKPIAEQRGVPTDFAVDDAYLHPLASLDLMDPTHRKYHEDGEPVEVWLGDHSHSWLTGDEIIAWADTDPRAVQYGVIGRADYDRWERGTRPAGGYSGDVYGNTVVRINDTDEDREKYPNWTHIRVHWTSRLADELAYFIDEVRRLVDQHGKIRFVFGFDS